MSSLHCSWYPWPPKLFYKFTCIMVTLSVVKLYGFQQMCYVMYLPLQYIPCEIVSQPPKFLVLNLFFPFLKILATLIFLFLLLFYLFQNVNIIGILSIAFFDCLLSCKNMHLSFLHFFPWLDNSFLIIKQHSIVWIYIHMFHSFIYWKTSWLLSVFGYHE